MQPMYSAMVNSPQTELASAIDDEQTTIPLLDASVLPAAPNLATIGTGEDAETILYTGVSGNDLTGVTRGFQGVAKAWSVGAKVARYFTAYDHDAFIENINTHAARHAAGGPDEITPEMIGAETPAGAQAKVDAHANRTDNPHGVTKTQVGLGNVHNYGIASQAQAEAGLADTVYMTPQRTKQYVDTRLMNNLQFRVNGGNLEYYDGTEWKPVGGIKNVQRGTAAVNGTTDVTIQSVNVNKSVVILSQSQSNDDPQSGVTKWITRGRLVSSNTLRLENALVSGYAPYVDWQVVEYY